MKKTILITILTILASALIACSKKDVTQNAVNGNTQESLNANNVSYIDMIPNLESIFKDGEFELVDGDGGSAYIVYISNYNYGEFAKLVTECKDMGWLDVAYDSENDFGAYKDDKSFWLQANQDNEKGIIYIICQTVEEDN